ncbi:RNA-directed DNA polymerase [Candidatus Saccharibacteria bacterium]|nr:RNA-directed DNA polymerase [Candidatus Saccharibacteria bacterium]
MAKRAKMRTEDEHKFEMEARDNVDQLAFDVMVRIYTPSRGKAFITHNPVIREIFAAPFRDRVIHHLLYALNGFWWDSRFIYDSYSCRDGKGTLLGIQRMQKFMEKASLAGSRPAYVLKGDISGYFMSLNREALFQRILWGLERQYPLHGWEYELCRYLWREIIFDDPVFHVRMAGGKKEWEPLPNNKSLFHQPAGQGIVIGNLTSQLLSNINLDPFDRFMKFDLGFEYYGRYVDDFFIIVSEEQFEYAKLMFEQVVPEFLEGMGHKMHPNKIYIQPITNGAPFLGAKVYRDHLIPGKRFQHNFYRAAQEYMNGMRDDESITSYLGMGAHFSAKKLNQKVFESVGWEYKF